MLVLTRRVGESITIGDNIRVLIMEVRGRQVRLGVEAPPDTVVHREEVYRRIQAANRAAAGVTDEHLARAASIWERKLLNKEGKGGSGSA